MSNFGNNLNNLRKKSGYSQEELAYKLNVSRQTISNWELEQTSPDLKDLKKISEIFNVSLNELISDSNIENKNIYTKYSNKKIILIILIIIIALILLLFSYRIFIISKIKKSIYNVSISNNVYIEKIKFSEKNSNQEVIEAYKLYFLDSKIKLVKLNNNDLSKAETIEIIDNDNYYFINETDKTFTSLPVSKFDNSLGKDFLIVKNELINEIYKNFSLFDNKEYLDLIFDFKFTTKKELSRYYSISNMKNQIDDYVSLKINNSLNEINYLRKIEKDRENNLSSIYSYSIKNDYTDSKDFEIPNLTTYQKLDI